MTKKLAGEELAERIIQAHPGMNVRWSDAEVRVEPRDLLEVARFLKESPNLDFAFLTSISGVDYVEYFEIVYHLLSMRRNHSAVLKTRCYGREEPSVSSVTSLWQGADFQEREIWDLVGVRFEAHPNMKRILLWEEFPGHPLRKDYLG